MPRTEGFDGTFTRSRFSSFLRMVSSSDSCFGCGFGCGLVLLAKNMKDNKKEIERIIKNWRIDLDNKSVYIESVNLTKGGVNNAGRQIYKR